MPVPRIEVPPYKPDENERKLTVIENALDDMGYECDGARDVIEIIEKHNLVKSQFEYPFGSYDTFRVHVLMGYYDGDESLVSHHMTDEEFEEFEKAVREGKIWITY